MKTREVILPTGEVWVFDDTEGKLITRAYELLTIATEYDTLQLLSLESGIRISSLVGTVRVAKLMRQGVYLQWSEWKVQSQQYPMI